MTTQSSDISPEAIQDAPHLPAFAGDWAFFLDVDGTLAHITPDPAAVTIETHVLDALRRLFRATGGALALITGRAIADIDRLFAPLRLPTAGQHGIERRSASGAMEVHEGVVRRLDAARMAFREFAAQHRGIKFEDKGRTLAMHYRRAPAMHERVLKFVEEQLEMLDNDFVLQPGKMVFEVRPGGRDKGTAIEAFMREPPFAGRMPVFVGDDKTDEDGFAVVNRLGGVSIKVGKGPTGAGWRLDNAAEVAGWLERGAAALERHGAAGR